MMVAEYNCMHEELIQDHSLKINELTSRADYKDKRIDDLYTKMEKMEEKILFLLMMDNIGMMSGIFLRKHCRQCGQLPGI